MQKRFKILAVLLVVGVAAGLFAVSYGTAAPGPNPAQPAAVSNLVQPGAQDASLSPARNTFVVQAVKSASPAIVGITNKAFMRDNFNQRVLVERGAASGVIFDANGYIVTNNHVVDGAQSISVSFADGRTLDGKVVGTDPATDLAVVKVEATGLPAADFGDSDSLLVGEPAIAIGNPLGMEFRGSVTVGVISALNRTIELGDRKFKLIQTDAAINPGNSGGALVNADGQVIGINSAKIAAEGVEGMGFAIPINSVRPILQQLMEKGKVARAYLGVGALDVAEAARYGYDAGSDHGVLLARVEKGGPASQADIREGDVIVKLNGTEVNSVADLRSTLDAIPVGSKVDVVIVRNGKERTVSATVTEMPN